MHKFTISKPLQQTMTTNGGYFYEPSGIVRAVFSEALNKYKKQHYTLIPSGKNPVWCCYNMLLCFKGAKK